MTDAEIIARLEKLFDVPFTFCLHCRSGLAHLIPGGRCNCDRCRAERGEPVTSETSAQAAAEAAAADSEWMRRELIRRAVTAGGNG